ncbi:AMP-binding protein [Anaerocolumna xylanovorans]|uniref:Long-chain acyl-CoA synthetase n=1 Tax=Anaerocolumna xylanovorans DSM 12503 TaxID=1121345 RepID=A0A1M7YLU0_9FIRM|nr:AMP-binding protein [Anaerocolumna xylanovorans]SHO53567.1 long-chain acyl-CoA synthetase [Anaerocolumna xylanovorans DSM 12503]
MKTKKTIETLAELLHFSVAACRNAPIAYIRNADSSEETSYQQFENDVKSAAHSYSGYNLNRRHVALWGPLSYEWMVSFFAIILSGGVAVLLDAGFTVETIEMLVEQSDTEIIILGYDYGKKLTSYVNSSKVFCIELWDKEKGQSGISAEKLNFEFSDVLPEQNAVLVFTSGTTGNYKMVPLTHKNLCSNIMSCYYYFGNSIKSYEIVMPLLPPNHMFGLTAGLLVPIYYGAAIGFGGSLKYVSKSITLFQPQYLVVVPAILDNIFHKIQLQLKNYGQKKLSDGDYIQNILGRNLKAIISGGAFLQPEICQVLQRYKINVCNGYGMTECSPIISCNPIGKGKSGSVGKLINPRFAKVRIQNGEIIIRGDTVMKGYYKNEEENYKIFEKGWLKTGDLGYLDEDNYLFLTGRKKNLIILADGNNVSPEELENELENNQLVKTVYVCEEKDRKYLVANIYPNLEYAQKNKVTDLQEALEKLIYSVNLKFPPYKRIFKFYIHNNDFDKTALGKIRRV